MSVFETTRFPKEIVPHNLVIMDWERKSEPGLMPSIERDYQRIREELFLGKTPEQDKKLYVATAGSPCAGKSTVLDQEVGGGNDPRYANAIVIDPDRYTMDYMFTYRNLLTAGKKAELGPEEAAKQAYDRARPGSNLISNTNLNEAFSRGYNIVHGTTSTTPFVGKFLQSLADEGYERRLLLCYAPDNMRVAAGEKRKGKEAHYQVDPSDFVEKGKAFPQRHEAYFANADHLVLFWKPQLEQNAIRAAEYRDGQKTILNQDAYDGYTQKYAADRQALAAENIVIPAWGQIEQTYFSRYAGSSAPEPKRGGSNPSPAPGV